MKRFMNDLAYRHWWFFAMTAIYHVAVPKDFPIVMGYFFFAAVVGHCVIFAVGRYKFAFITYAIMSFLVLMIIFSLLVDGWCLYFQYRGNKHDFSVVD